MTTTTRLYRDLAQQKQIYHQSFTTPAADSCLLRLMNGNVRKSQQNIDNREVETRDYLFVMQFRWMFDELGMHANEKVIPSLHFL